MMRYIFSKALIIVSVVIIVGFALDNSSFAQGGMGAPTKSSPATPAGGGSSPGIRKRNTNFKRRTVREAPQPVETADSGPAENTVTPGLEEKKQGLEAYNKEDYETAAAKLAEAGSHLPTDPEIFYPLGDSYSFKKDWTKAIEAYARALKFGEAKATADNYYYLGNAYEQTSKYVEAFAAYKKSDEKRPNNAETLTRLGDVASNLSEWQAAINYYQRAFDIDPNISDADVFFNWAVAYVNGPKNHESAVRRFQRAIELNVDKVNEAYYLLAMSCKATGRNQEAIDAFLKQLEKRNDDYFAWKAYFNVAELYFAQRDWQAAIRAEKGAVGIDPKDGFSWDNLGTALNNVGSYAESAEAYRQATLLMPNRPDWLLHLGRAYYRAEKHAEAIEALSRAIDLQPNFPDAFYFRGIAHRSLGQYEQAVSSLMKALELGLSSKIQEASARYNLAISYAKGGNVPAARQQCDLLSTFGTNAPPDSFNVCRP